MKAHEETWAAARGIGGSRNPCVESESGGVVAVVQVPYTPAGKSIRMLPETAMERARLLAAAPEMARALLVLLKSIERLEGDGGLNVVGLAVLDDMRNTLKKAGVL